MRKVLAQYEEGEIGAKKHRLLLGVVKNHPEKFKDEWREMMASQRGTAPTPVH